MILKKISILFLISILFTGCQTIKEKSNAIAEKENKEYGKLVGKNITELKIKLGNPTEDFINEITLISIFLLDNKKISIGVKKTDTIVEKKVQTIESATFPLHKYVIKFEAVPPGQQPNIITPRESSGGISKVFTNKSAATGIIVNWRNVTKKNNEGFFNIFLKSVNSKVIPIKNITRPKKTGM